MQPDSTYPSSFFQCCTQDVRDMMTKQPHAISYTAGEKKKTCSFKEVELGGDLEDGNLVIWGGKHPKKKKIQNGFKKKKSKEKKKKKKQVKKSK